LRCLAKGDFYSEVAEIHGVSRSSVSRHIWQVITELKHVHVGEHKKYFLPGQTIHTFNR